MSPVALTRTRCPSATHMAEGDVEALDALTLLRELHDTQVSDAHALGQRDVSKLLVRRENDQLLRDTKQIKLPACISTACNVIKCLLSTHRVACVATGNVE